ncbi:hypothetical protein Y032_0010g1035 [Ancylostoma ceylanicum]|nr:hypothetical protein Y032_0010g1035 [Ancylostoma ceylanicum]
MRYFQLFLLVNTALWTGAQERCSPDVDLSVPLRVVDHGSLNSFLSIARGIAHTVQPEMSKATMDEIYTSLKTKNIDVSKITSMVIEEQVRSHLMFTNVDVTAE